jgi:hypothetical protein
VWSRPRAPLCTGGLSRVAVIGLTSTTLDCHHQCPPELNEVVGAYGPFCCGAVSAMPYRGRSLSDACFQGDVPGRLHVFDSAMPPLGGVVRSGAPAVYTVPAGGSRPVWPRRC